MGVTYTIPLMRHTFAREPETLAALSAWLANNPIRLSMGEQCRTFEQQFAERQGRKHAILFNSGASANLALIQALKNLGRIPEHRPVGFSALTWATNVMPLQQMGYSILPIDISPSTLNVMSYTLEPTLDKIGCLFITNALGFLPDLDTIAEVCREHGILLLEDNCESLGSGLPSGRAGNFGLASTFSFFVAHHMSTIEGGMICTDDPGLANMLMMVRANGWDRNLSAEVQQRWRDCYRITDDFEVAYTFYVPAFNMRPTEVTGFLGCEQLRYLDDALKARARRFEQLETIAWQNGDFIALDHSHMACLSPFAFPVVCQTAELAHAYRERFQNAGVEIRPIIAGNIVRQPFLRECSLHPLPGADFVQQRGFYFGIYPELTDRDIAILSECLSRQE